MTMTYHAGRPPFRKAVAARRSRIERGVGLIALVLMATTLGGCSLTMLVRRVGIPLGSPQAKTPEAPQGLAGLSDWAALHPEEPYWPYRLGQLHLAADSLLAAEDALKASLRCEPTYAPALALLSKLYFDSGRHGEALKILEPVRTRPADYPREVRQVLLAGLALHEDALGHPDLAAATLKEAHDRDLRQSGSATVYVTLRGSNPDSATALAAEVLRGEPRSAVNLNNFGITRLRAGDPDAARGAFLSAIERDPNLPGPYYNLAILDKYYLFDDAAATGWFRNYWNRCHEDPDSLLGVFAESAQKNLAQKGN